MRETIIDVVSHNSLRMMQVNIEILTKSSCFPMHVYRRYEANSEGLVCSQFKIKRHSRIPSYFYVDLSSTL